MGNIQGQFDVGSFYNITAAAPLDVRTLVKTELDLIAEDSWNKKTHPPYKGMMVTVQETGNVYTLIDVDNVHSIDGWKKVGSSATSDWLAEENETGYIKNKPFGANYKLGALSDLTPYIEVSTYYDLIFIKENIILASVKNDYVGNVTLSSSPPTYCKVEIVTDQGRIYKKLTLINNGNYHSESNPVYVFAGIIPLDERYIPDTVVKTTPQSLSDDDKNQVKENLGLHDAMLNVTYSELKSLRDNSQLIPGQQYRITDYVTTTAQENTQSAGHAFDLIVVADDEKTLNEEARACVHDGDIYFANSNLATWKIWYCLDNDAERFAWADATNGKGVIYHMIDEYGNECPYDFKNIQFRHPNDTDTYPDYYYTFTWIDENYDIMDTSIFGNNGTLTCYGEIYGVYSNVIKPYMAMLYDEDSDEYLGTKQLLNSIIFISDYKYEGGNDGFFGCSNNSFGTNCFKNSFGNDCSVNSFGNNCYRNSFGNNCYRNSFGDDCSHNSFGNGCYDNSFGNNCYNNSFGNGCYDNSFGNDCSVNSFGNDCYNNSFGSIYSSNSFGNRCSHNSFGNNCYDNSFRNNCYNNSFGNNCYFNSFGNYFSSNSFGDSCHDNSFRTNNSTAATILNYCRYNHFDDGCSYNIVYNTTTTGSNNQLQNVNINRGIFSDDEIYNTISIDTLNANYEIQVAKNSKGDIKIYCEADLIA